MEIQNEQELTGAFHAMWDHLHNLAYESDTREASEAFGNYTLPITFKNFFCDRCRPHANEYLEKNPYEPYKYLRDVSGKYIGPFLYMHAMHNSVNERLGKPQMSLPDALEKQRGRSMHCNAGCSIQPIPENSHTVNPIPPNGTIKVDRSKKNSKKRR